MVEEIPIAVSSFEIEWLRPDGSVDYVESASVRQTAMRRWLVAHKVRGETVYKEIYAQHPRGDEQLGDESAALEDLNCLWREFWEPITTGEARLSKRIETENRVVVKSAQVSLAQRGPRIERISGFCPVRSYRRPVRVHGYRRRR